MYIVRQIKNEEKRDKPFPSFAEATKFFDFASAIAKINKSRYKAILLTHSNGRELFIKARDNTL